MEIVDTMRTFKTISLLLLILLFSAEVMAGGYGVSGVGTRAISMGGAFRAIADDWSAAYYNPAGLTNVYENQFNLGFDFYNNRPEFTPDVNQNGYSLGYFDDKRVPNDQIAYTPNISGMFVIPVFENVTAGFAIFQPYDYVSEWDIFRLSPTYNQYIEDTITYPVAEPVVPFPDYTHRMNLDIIDFHPTVAAELIEDQLSLGIGLSIMKGSFLNNQLVLIPSTLPEEFSFRPYDYLVQTSELDVEGWGLGFNLGLLYKINEKLTLGASYQSKTTISLDGSAITKFYAPGNRHVVDAADTSSIAKEIFQGDIYTAIHDVETEWTVPSEFGFGLAYQLSEKVQAAVDFTYTMWSEYKDLEIDVKASQGLTNYELINDLLIPTDVVNMWDDAFRISAGVEGQINEKWTLRGGYCFDQSPIPDENANVYFNSPADRHQLTGGASLVIGKMEFFGAAGIAIASESTVDDLSDLDGDGVFDNLSGIYTNTLFVTSFGFTVRF